MRLSWTSALIVAFALVCLSAAPIAAQQDLDSVKADAAHHTVVFENDQVRVVRYQIPAGGKTAMHSHPANVNILFTDVNATITTQDGKSSVVQGKAGAAAWRTATAHMVVNTGDKPIEGVLVEPKKPHSARPAGSADETTFPNSPAKVVFENEQVRVVRYRLEPGQEDPTHGHPDNVLVALTDAKVKVTTDGKTAQVTTKADQVNWRPATVHSVQNIGDQPLEGILVEMKGGGAMGQ
jgi:quercetin dioxygenase-like cupin family protein